MTTKKSNKKVKQIVLSESHVKEALTFYLLNNALYSGILNEKEIKDITVETNISKKGEVSYSFVLFMGNRDPEDQTQLELFDES